MLLGVRVHYPGVLPGLCVKRIINGYDPGTESSELLSDVR